MFFVEVVTREIDPMVKGAEQLGALSSNSVWALFSFLFISYIGFDLRAKAKSNREILDVRLAESKADVMMAAAIDNMADEIKELRHKLDNRG